MNLLVKCLNSSVNILKKLVKWSTIVKNCQKWWKLQGVSQKNGMNRNLIFRASYHSFPVTLIKAVQDQILTFKPRNILTWIKNGDAHETQAKIQVNKQIDSKCKKPKYMTESLWLNIYYFYYPLPNILISVVTVTMSILCYQVYCWEKKPFGHVLCIVQG